VQVVARRGGVGQAILLVTTLVVIAVAFVVGIGFGVAAALVPTGAGMPLESIERAGDPWRRVAIVAIEGAIDDRTAADVDRAFRAILDDGSFVAVVLRVDSPGGAVSPSDRIWDAVDRLRNTGMPVVASYGGIAASGGVFVSCGADHIVAERTAITGSVGVIASVLTLGDLMNKVGVEPVTIVASGSPRKSEANDPYRPWDEADRAVVRRMLDHAHAIFIERVMAGRSSRAADPDALRAALDGRVLTAPEAVAAGLVDEIGYLEQAIVVAEQLGGVGVGTAEVVRFFEPAPFFGGGLLGSVRALLGGRGGSDVSVSELRDAALEATTPRLEYTVEWR
jgi:protease-4